MYSTRDFDGLVQHSYNAAEENTDFLEDEPVYEAKILRTNGHQPSLSFEILFKDKH